MLHSRGVIFSQRPYDYERNGYHNFGGRHSIDDVSGRPIYIEDFVLPTFKNSTLICEFEFPFTLSDADTVSIISDNDILLDPSITKISDNTVSIRWEDSVTTELESNSVKTFRVKVTNSDTGIVKTYNEITIKLY